MELRHLRYFTAVVQWQGYREASRRLHVAQPAISQAVADLESELGVKLFLRKKRRVSLTPEGDVFHSEALLTLAQAERAAESARRAARGEVGSLRLGFLGAASYAFLPELVRQYRAQRPGVKITLRELTPTQQAQAFAKGEIDVGVATLERRSIRWDKDDVGPVRCGIANNNQSRRRGRWLGAGRWPLPSARSNACRNAPFDL